MLLNLESSEVADLRCCCVSFSPQQSLRELTSKFAAVAVGKWKALYAFQAQFSTAIMLPFAAADAGNLDCWIKPPRP